MAVRVELTRGLICGSLSRCRHAIEGSMEGGRLGGMTKSERAYGIVDYPLDGHQDLERNRHGVKAEGAVGTGPSSGKRWSQLWDFVFLHVVCLVIE